jgi:lipoprotein-anchoring transpeptidase ErfK/SrfK
MGAVLAIVLLFVGIVLVVDATGEDKIADGTKIGTLDAGGLDRSAATRLVRSKFASAAREPVEATYKTQRFVLRPDDASVRVDVESTVDEAMASGRAGDAFSRVLGGGGEGGTIEPKVTLSRAAVSRFVERTADRVDRRARDADIDWHDGKLVRVRARSGVEVQRPKLTALLERALVSPSGSRTVKVPVKVTERPDRTFEDFAERYPVVLAVDRDAKVLRLYENLKLSRRYKIAVGKAGVETAAGRYKIREKTVNPTWHVPMSDWAGDLAGQTIPPDDPRNPLEARWMGFHDGQGIHGTDDVASLGTAASHGCIRMSVPDVKRLFRKVKVGTPLFLQ